jgi:8-oxo-dGTP pyrophosphatase MutT (NUDIX family)
MAFNHGQPLHNQLQIKNAMYFMKREFTATVYLIDNQKILLIFHPKFQKWLPPGGHVEPNETPPETARREVKEETGFDIEFLSKEELFIDYWNAKSIERPYLCLLENIPPYQQTPAHQHIDFIYIAKPAGNPTASSLPYQWFDWNQLQSLNPDENIFRETLTVIQHLLSTGS